MKELTNIDVKRKLWIKAKIKDIPEDRKLIGSKWVFKRKKSRIFCTCLCALGYSQILGVDFTENFVSVVNNITLHLVLLKWLMNPSWEAEVYDIETAYLYRELEEPIYMKILKSMEYLNDDYNPATDCLLLTKAIYGIVQAPGQNHVCPKAFTTRLFFSHKCVFYFRKGSFLLYSSL